MDHFESLWKTLKGFCSKPIFHFNLILVLDCFRFSVCFSPQTLTVISDFRTSISQANRHRHFKKSLKKPWKCLEKAPWNLDDEFLSLEGSSFFMISVFYSIPLAISLVMGIASIAFIKSFADNILCHHHTFYPWGYERLQLLISGQ